MAATVAQLLCFLIARRGIRTRRRPPCGRTAVANRKRDFEAHLRPQSSKILCALCMKAHFVRLAPCAHGMFIQIALCLPNGSGICRREIEARKPLADIRASDATRVRIVLLRHSNYAVSPRRQFVLPIPRRQDNPHCQAAFLPDDFYSHRLARRVPHLGRFFLSPAFGLSKPKGMALASERS